MLYTNSGRAYDRKLSTFILQQLFTICYSIQIGSDLNLNTPMGKILQFAIVIYYILPTAHPRAPCTEVCRKLILTGQL